MSSGWAVHPLIRQGKMRYSEIFWLDIELRLKSSRVNLRHCGLLSYYYHSVPTQDTSSSEGTGAISVQAFDSHIDLADQKRIQSALMTLPSSS